MLQKSQIPDGLRLSFTWGSKIGGLPRITTQWDSNGIPMGFQWDSNGIPMGFQWDSNLSTGSIQSITVKIREEHGFQVARQHYPKDKWS